ncbi:MAG: hypothetical protein IPM88_20710 [Nitrospira sp.]|nr:hypothetical protein [Nitrospira sp.]
MFTSSSDRLLIPLRHLMAASLVSLLFIGLAPSPSMPPVVEARPVLPVQKAAPAAVIVRGSVMKRSCDARCAPRTGG